jgi:hypothetical protein
MMMKKDARCAPCILAFIIRMGQVCYVQCTTWRAVRITHTAAATECSAKRKAGGRGCSNAQCGGRCHRGGGGIVSLARRQCWLCSRFTVLPRAAQHAADPADSAEEMWRWRWQVEEADTATEGGAEADSGGGGGGGARRR